MGGGDDLEDQFILDTDLVALSEGEDGDVLSDDPEVATEEVSGVNQKKRKRREKEKEKKAKRKRVAENLDVEETQSLAAQPPAALSEYLSTLQAKTFSQLSPLELQDIRIPDTTIADTTAWTGSRDLDRLPDFIAKMLPSLRLRLTQKSKNNGAPTLLFIAGAALRVTDVTRTLKDRKIRGDKGGDVAKLFARHFKLEDHVAYLKRTKIGSAVGTPGRIGKLLCETDAISLSALSHIVLDVTHRDAKKRSMLDIPETRDEVLRTVLGADRVRTALAQGKVQLVLF